jgi:hypothetical protein
MPPKPAFNPLAPFTRDYFTTAKGNDVMKRLTQVYGVLVKLDQPEDNSVLPGLDNISAGIVDSLDIRTGKDNVSSAPLRRLHDRDACGTARSARRRWTHKCVRVLAGSAHAALLRRRRALPPVRA